MKLHKKILAVCLLLSFSVLGLVTPSRAAEQANGVVSITFDDGYLDNYTEALPVLAANQQPATAYIVTNLVGQTGYLSWDNLSVLAERYGWEIGSHSVSHAELPKISKTKIQQEVTKSYDALKQKGFEAVTFATPYGAYNNYVLTTAAKTYEAHRGYWDTGYNSWPYNNSVLRVQMVLNNTSMETIQQWIDYAMLNKFWLILSFHQVTATDNGYTYAYPADKLKTVSDYLKNNNIPVKTVAQVLEHSGNLVNNYTFENGLNNWTTDNATQVKVDVMNNGEYPSIKNSVKITGATKASHLFSDKITVQPGVNYGVKVYVDASSFKSGEVGFYADEYDANGNWLSWQWWGGYNQANVATFNHVYITSSDQVAQVELKVYMDPKSKGYVFLDNFELY